MKETGHTDENNAAAFFFPGNNSNTFALTKLTLVSLSGSPQPL